MASFHRFLNGLRPSIKFTYDMEKDQELAFLDVLIRMKGGARFGVFRKAMHRGAYLEQNSCHPRSVFRGIVCSLKRRMKNVCLEQKKDVKRKFVA